MSGPIVRKYGFPNFDKIFGPKPVLHGVDDETPKPEGEGKGPEHEAPSKADSQAGSVRGPSEGGGGPVG
jgi:hypothetical protein